MASGKTRVFLGSLLFVAGAACATAPSDGPAGERFTATLVSLGSTPGSSTAPVLIHVNGYSTADEVERLAQVLDEKGTAALQEEIHRLDRGWIRIGDSRNYTLGVVLAKETPSGRKISILLNRPVQFAELFSNLRTENYPFAYVELNLDETGRGEGQLVPAGQVRLRREGIEVVGIGFQPARLLSVKGRAG